MRYAHSGQHTRRISHCRADSPCCRPISSASADRDNCAHAGHDCSAATTVGSSEKEADGHSYVLLGPSSCLFIRRRRCDDARQSGDTIFQIHSPQMKLNLFDLLQASMSDPDSPNILLTVHLSDLHQLVVDKRRVSLTPSGMRDLTPRA